MPAHLHAFASNALDHTFRSHSKPPHADFKCGFLPLNQKTHHIPRFVKFL